MPLALFGKFVKVLCSLLLLVSLCCVPGCARLSGSKEEGVVGLCSQELQLQKGQPRDGPNDNAVCLNAVCTSDWDSRNFG